MNKAAQARKLGVLDFLQLIYDGHPEYSLIAVKAPIEQTVQALIEFRQGQPTKERMDYKTFRMKERKITDCQIRWEQNIPLRSSLPESDEFAWALPVLKVEGSEWTVILRSLAWLSDEIYDVPREAKALAALLQTKTITLMEEDTSGAIAYKLFDNGELLESFEAADEVQFCSQGREKPALVAQMQKDEEIDEFDPAPNDGYDVGRSARNRFVDEFFQELGIYLPACYPVTDNGKPALAVEPASANRIERADWLSIEETLEGDRQEPDPDDAE